MRPQRRTYPAGGYTEGSHGKGSSGMSSHPPTTKTQHLCFLHPQALMRIFKYSFCLGSKMSPTDASRLLCAEVKLKRHIPDYASMNSLKNEPTEFNSVVLENSNNYKI